MATSKIPRPYVQSFLGTDYYREHVVNSALTLGESANISSRVVNGICFVRITGCTLNQIGNSIQILDGLPLSAFTTSNTYIKSQESDKTLKYIKIIKPGSVNTSEDGLYISTGGYIVGETIGDLFICYPIR